MTQRSCTTGRGGTGPAFLEDLLARRGSPSVPAGPMYWRTRGARGARSAEAGRRGPWSHCSTHSWTPRPLAAFLLVATLRHALLDEYPHAALAEIGALRRRRRWRLTALETAPARHVGLRRAILLGPPRRPALLGHPRRKHAAPLAATRRIRVLAVGAALAQEMTGPFLASLGIVPFPDARFEELLGRVGAALSAGRRRRIIAALGAP